MCQKKNSFQNANLKCQVRIQCHNCYLCYKKFVAQIGNAYITFCRHGIINYQVNNFLDPVKGEVHLLFYILHKPWLAIKGQFQFQNNQSEKNSWELVRNVTSLGPNL